MNGEFYSEDNVGLISELRRGFENLGRDIRGALGTVNAGMQTMSNDVRYGAGITREAGRTFTRGAGGKAYSFIGETFSKEFNKPALWSRDITYMLGKDPRDMSKAQAQYYARQNWNQRFSQLGSFAAKDVAPFAMMFAGVPGMVAAAGYSAFVSPHIVDQKALGKWKNYLDKTSQSYVLAAHSQNTVTGRGWSGEQREDIGRFHLQYERENKYFNKEEQFGIEQLATSQGYYQKTTSVAQYKRKYKQLIEGTKEVMKTLHMSMEEAVGVMSEIGRMKVPDQKGFIKGVGLASAYSGLSSEQVMKYAGAFGAGMTRRGFTPGYGANVGLELLKSDSRDFMAYSLDRYTKDPMMMAALYNKKGGFDQTAFTKFISGKMGMQEVLSRGAMNVAAYQSGGTWGTFQMNREKLMAENIPPDQMARIGSMMSYQTHLFQTQGTPYANMDFYLSELKRKGFSQEQVMKVRKDLTDPFGEKQWNVMASGIRRPIQGGNILSRTWGGVKDIWGETFGTLSEAIGGVISDPTRIEERGQLKDKYLSGRRMKEFFRESGVSVGKMGKWLGATRSEEEFYAFVQKERDAGSETKWELYRSEWKALETKKSVDEYNRLAGFIQGNEKVKYDKDKADVNYARIAKVLRGVNITTEGPDAYKWFGKIAELRDKYGGVEFDVGLRDWMRVNVGGENLKYMPMIGTPGTGVTSVSRKWLADKESELIRDANRSLYGGRSNRIARRLGVEIQNLSIWGKWEAGEFKGSTEEMIDLAHAQLMEAGGAGGKISAAASRGYMEKLAKSMEDSGVLKGLRERAGEIAAGGLGTIEDIQAGLLGSGGGAYIAESLRSVADGMYLLKESIELMNKDLKEQRKP